MRKKRLLLLSWPLFLALLLPLTLSGCLSYLVQAGAGQVQILRNRRPFSEVLADPSVPEDVKEKIRHVERVRVFAREKLGLTLSGSFTSYTYIGRDAASYTVTASEALRFHPRTWWFPVVGRVPYLGFFSRERAESSAERLEKKGWDVSVGGVPAYSTLGWFDDPLLSSQVNYSRWYLTSLVIHEAAHSTLWFPGDVSFNESFATFVEEQGALEYYKEEYGADSREYRERLLYLKEERLLYDFFHDYVERLERLYESGLPERQKRERKVEILKELKEELTRTKKFTLFDTGKMAAKNYNNAVLLSYRRYGSGEFFFRSEFEKKGGNWELFLKRMAEFETMDPQKRAVLLRKTR